jgi:hypothetical protein
MDNIHLGSKETYEKIANWGGEELPFSKYLRWDRMGLLAILADYFLNYSKGHILEIGAGESTVYFTYLAKKYNRKAYFCDIQRSIYENALTVPGYFDDDVAVISEDGKRKISYAKNTLFIGSSDAFFKEVELPQIAVAFIDGSHNVDFVRRDFYNILPLIEETGAIFIHDTMPLDETYLHENACGDGYKLRQELEIDPRLDTFCFLRSAHDVGLLMVRRKPENLPYYKK